jgi:hypothetical protein
LFLIPTSMMEGEDDRGYGKEKREMNNKTKRGGEG